MKKLKLVVLSSLLVFVSACSKSDDSPNNNDDVLVGQDGNPRFNLVFTNPENVDLDLYVKAPDGTVINYSNRTGAGGTLDVDCLCGSCSQGPNENIYWEAGSAPSGTYEYWVEYYNDCGSGGNDSSSFTIRTIRNGSVLQTKTGTLSSGQSQVYTHVQP